MKGKNISISFENIIVVSWEGYFFYLYVKVFVIVYFLRWYRLLSDLKENFLITVIFFWMEYY